MTFPVIVPLVVSLLPSNLSPEECVVESVMVDPWPSSRERRKAQQA